MTLEELVRNSEAARLRLTESHARLKHTLDFPSRAKESLMEKPGQWLVGSIIAGFMGSFLFRKQKSTAKVSKLKSQRGFLLGLISLAFTMGRPLAKIYATKLLKDHLANRFASGSRARLANAGKPPY